jgi:hypothetical protein
MDGRREYLHPENVEVVTVTQLPDDGRKLAQADKTDDPVALITPGWLDRA